MTNVKAQEINEVYGGEYILSDYYGVADQVF